MAMPSLSPPYDPYTMAGLWQSVVDSLRNWSELQAIDILVWDYTDPMNQAPDKESPGIDDTPCVEVFPAAHDPNWHENRAQKSLVTFTVTLWTKTYYPPYIFYVEERVRRALWQSAATGHTLTYIQEASGFHPVYFTNFRYAKQRLNNRNTSRAAIRMDGQLVLQYRDDPLGP